MDAAPDFRRLRFPLEGGEMAGLAFGREGPPDILFLHATGFNARAYRTLLSPLGDLFGVLAVDLRGHGLSTLPARTLGYASWTRHRDDVVALITQHMGKPVLLAGHSLGATTALLVAGARPDLARGLCLVDPVIMPSSLQTLMRMPGATLAARWTFPIARKAGQRRATFESREAAQAALTGRGIFAAFTPEALEDYVADGFVDEGSGVRLACRPRYEAATFAAQGHDPVRAFRRAPGPIVILRPERGSTFDGGEAAKIAERRADVRVVTIPGATHALPFEKPDRVRAAIEGLMVRIGQQGLRDYA